MGFTYTIHYQICDNVLENICSGNDMHEVNIEPFLGEDRRVKLAIVRKLDQDGFIRRVNAQTEPFVISVTVEGVQFWIDGGYKSHFENLYEKENLEKSLLRTNISTNKSVQNSNRLQIIIAFLVAIFVALSTIYQVKTYRLDYEKKRVSGMPAHSKCQS